ncbi:MAG TPA: DUF5522 domain-containing protein [Acidobacteriaceae bacterium]|nr:DUF5522 domain-containing protein [Acidobacteriaceae bacterium]
MQPAEDPGALSARENSDEDYYFDGPYLVFTAAYHLRRGFCCQCGCRHCPYGSPNASVSPKGELDKEC